MNISEILGASPYEVEFLILNWRNLLKKIPSRVYSWGFAGIFQSICFLEHPWVNASATACLIKVSVGTLIEST